MSQHHNPGDLDLNGIICCHTLTANMITWTVAWGGIVQAEDMYKSLLTGACFCLNLACIYTLICDMMQCVGNMLYF